MQREKFGPRSERSQRLIDQLELQLEELAAAAGENEAKAEARACRPFLLQMTKVRTTAPADGGSAAGKAAALWAGLFIYR